MVKSAKSTGQHRFLLGIYVNLSLMMVLFLLICGQLDWRIFPPVAELPTNLQVPLVKEIFAHVAVLCCQSGVKEQEEIVILAHNFCGRCMQRVLSPLNPHSLVETAEKTWHRLRFIQDTGKCVDLHKTFQDGQTLNLHATNPGNLYFVLSRQLKY